MENPIIKNNMFFIIPSWSELLGNPCLGEYNGEKVSKILEDPILFLGGLETTKISNGESIYAIFGIGYYYVKFETREGTIGTSSIDTKDLSGLILSDFLYDYLAVGEDLTLQNDPHVVVTEKIIKVPIDMIRSTYAGSSRRNFISDTLMKHVFIPYKNIIVEMMHKIQNDEKEELSPFNFKNRGHLLLCANNENYNSIIVSKNLEKDKDYLNSKPGINSIEVKAEEFLSNLFTDSEIEKIERNMRTITRVYTSLPYDPLHLFSIIEQAAFSLESSIPSNISNQKKKSELEKKSILISADDRLNQIQEWPIDRKFKRRTKEELEAMVGMGEFKDIIRINDDTGLQEKEFGDRGKVEPHLEGIENFELRALKNEYAESRELPEIPTTKIDEILFFIKFVVEENYEMKSIGEAFEKARDNIQKLTLRNIKLRTQYSSIMVDMDRFSHIYKKKEANLALKEKEKTQLLEKINDWIGILNNIQ